MRPSLLILLTAGLAAAVPDPRYGLVGSGGKAMAQKLGVSYYALEGNYPASGSVFSSVDPANDPPAGYKVLRKVAKLNVRNDTLGQTNAQFRAALSAYANSLALWHTLHIGAKPTFTWYAPNAAALAAAESLQIITTIRREKALVPAVTGTVWEIGNEPNLFPAVLPARYAEVFSRYYRIIKAEDPAAKVAMGPVFAREIAMDLIPRMQEALTAELVAGGLGQPGQPVFDSVNADMWKTFSARVLNLGTVDYFTQCFAAMDSTVRPDVISLHVYPFEDRLPVLSEDAVKQVLDSLADTLGAIQVRRGVASAAIWITEFGNVNPGKTDAQAASQASQLLDVFTANARVKNWFYYKGTGTDEQLAVVPDMPAPLTRLARDASFEPSDGNFPCGRLNAIGRMYYLRAVGEPCLEKAGFATAASTVGFSDVVVPTSSIRVRLGQAEVDTVRLSVVHSDGTLIEGTDFTFAPAALVFSPGDTSGSVTVTWKTRKAGTILFKLRDPVNAGLSGDSTHTLTTQVFVGAVLPGRLPGGFALALDRAGPALVLSGPDNAAVRVRILDAAGKSRTLLRGPLSGRRSVSLRAADGALPAGIYRIEVTGPGFRKILRLSWLNL